MRNRITWKGFGKWLMSQKNTREFYTRDSCKCPVAAYVNYALDVKSARAGIKPDKCNSDIVYYVNNSEVSVTAPKIFYVFMGRFDHQHNSGRHALPAIVAKNVYNKINQEEGIV